MAGIDQVRLLLKELGPALELGAIRELPGGTAWGLATQDSLILFLEYTPDDDRLWLSAEAGTPRAEERAGLYPLMLQYNAQWRQTGGARVALEADDAVVLACDVPVAGLDLPRLCAIIRNFQVMLEGWSAILSGAGRASTGPAPADTLVAASGVIRG